MLALPRNLAPLYQEEIVLTPIAYGLAVLLNVAIAVIGVRFFVAPRTAAAGYGVPAEEGDAAYLTVKAVRDTTFGILGLTLVAFAGPHAAALFMLVAALAPLGDTAIVLRHGGTKRTAFGIHFATAVAVLVDAALLFAIC
jgi:Domain of unknown function (DUF4267)